MGICPFCSQQIPENTLLYGGSCPKCFGEIPGEEAATDPGAEVRAKQQRSDTRRATVKTLIPLLLMVPMLGVLVVVALGFVIWNRNPYLEPLDLDAFDGVASAYDDSLITADPVPEAAPDPKTPKPMGTAGNPTRQPNPTQVAAAPGKPTPIQGGQADPRPQTVDATKGIGGLAGLAGGLDAATNRSREGVELTDPDQISKMVRAAISRQAGTLNACYSEALQRNPQLGGQWKAAFVIQKTGFPSDISFTGRVMSDAQMEACLVKAVAGWSFGKIVAPLPVQKTWRFEK